MVRWDKLGLVFTGPALLGLAGVFGVLAFLEINHRDIMTVHQWWICYTVLWIVATIGWVLAKSQTIMFFQDFTFSAVAYQTCILFALTSVLNFERADTAEFSSSKYDEISSSAYTRNYVFFMTIMILNLFFSLSWAYKILSILISALRKKWGGSCSWGNVTSTSSSSKHRYSPTTSSEEDG